LQEVSDEDIQLIEKLSPKLKILGSSVNLQLAYAIDTLFNAATMPFVLLLEKDWEVTVGVTLIAMDNYIYHHINLNMDIWHRVKLLVVVKIV
jgi:hypothetical protein